MNQCPNVECSTHSKNNISEEWCCPMSIPHQPSSECLVGGEDGCPKCGGNRMKTQLEFLKEAVALAEANPTLKIKIASSDDHIFDGGWTEQKIAKVEKSKYYSDDGLIMTDIDIVIDHLQYDNDREFTEDEALEHMEEVILIYTGV